MNAITPPMTTPSNGTPTPSKVSKSGKGSLCKRPLHAPQEPPTREARQRAAAILEVLAGARTPTDAAAALGTSLQRYYLLEDKALAGLLRACERQPRGPRTDSARRCQTLERECERWRCECTRLQTLVRAAQRGIGLPVPPPTPAKPAGKKQRKRKPTVRALHAVARLRQEEESAGVVVSTPTPVQS
jgi:hypothetical protein